jgi:hypothetical protein
MPVVDQGIDVASLQIPDHQGLAIPVQAVVFHCQFLLVLLRHRLYAA